MAKCSPSNLRIFFDEQKRQFTQSRGLQFFALSLFLLMFFLDFGESTKFWQRLSDYLHTPIFFFATLLLWFVLGESRSAQCAAVFTCLCAATFIEFAQPFFGRSESIVDFENGFFGILLAAIAISIHRIRSLMLGLVLFPLLAFVFVLPLKPAWNELELRKERFAKLPLIADFETASDLRFTEPIAENPPRESLQRLPQAHGGKYALAVETVPFQYSGVEFGLDSMDWTSFRALQFYVYSSEAFDLQIRIDDWENCIAFDKRFNAVFKLSAGWNKIEIPIEEISRTPSGRPLQTRELKRLLIFRSASQSSSSFLLDDLKLIN